MKAEGLTVYVIWWRDAECRAGVSRVHTSEQRAEEERDLLEAEQPGREYNISCLSGLRIQHQGLV